MRSGKREQTDQDQFAGSLLEQARCRETVHFERGKAAGWTHVSVDGTLIRTDRCRTNNPDTGHDLWFSGKHHVHGGNVQIVSDPDGHPVAVSDVQPGSTHDLAAARATGFLGALHAAAALLGLPALADKGYDGAGAGVLTPTKG